LERLIKLKGGNNLEDTIRIWFIKDGKEKGLLGNEFTFHNFFFFFFCEW
jgi:hypothetical protein